MTKMADERIEEDLHTEKEAVIRYGEKRFRRRSCKTFRQKRMSLHVAEWICVQMNGRTVSETNSMITL